MSCSYCKKFYNSTFYCIKWEEVSWDDKKRVMDGKKICPMIEEDMEKKLELKGW